MTNVGEVDIKVALDKASLSSSLRSAKGDVDSWANDVESRTSKLGSAIGGIAKTGLLAAGTAAVAVTTAGLSSYRDLEEASSHAASKAVDVYGKSTEEISAEYDKLLKHVQDVSADVGASTVFSDIEVAKTFDALAAGGVDISNVGRTQLLPFMNLASSTGEDLTKVTDLLTGSMASFGYGMDDSALIADQLAMAMNGSKASMETLNYALRQGGSTAAATGMELDEFSAIVGVLADRNYTGEQSGAALKTAMLALYNPTKTQKEALDKLGISYDQIDPRTNDFRKSLELMVSKGADIGDFGQIFTDSSGSIMYALAGAGDSVDALKTKIDGSQGLSQTMSDLMMDSDRLVGAWELAKGATMGLVTSFGAYLEPASVRILNLWSDLVGKVRDFAGAINSGNWTLAGQMIESGIRTGLSALADIGQVLYSYILNYDYGAAGSAIAGWIRSGFAYLSDLGSSLYGWITNYDFTTAGSTIAGWIRSGIEILQDIGATIGGWIESHGGWQGIGKSVGEKIAAGIKALTTYANGIADRLKEWYNSSGQGIGQDIGNKIAAGIKAVQTYADGIKNKLQDWINSGGAASLGYDIGNRIAEAIKSVADLGRWIADSLTEKGGGSLIRGAIETAVEWVSLGASAVSQFVSGFVEGLSPIGASIYNTIIDAVSGALNMMPYGVGEGLASSLQSTKMEVDWSKKSYDTSTGKWLTSSYSSSSRGSDIAADTGVARTGNGSLAAYWRNGQLMISEGIGSGKYITAEEWAKSAGKSGKYSEEDIINELKLMYGKGGVATSSKDRDQIVGWFREGAKQAAAIETTTTRTNAAVTTTTTKASANEIYKATQNYKTTGDSVNAAMVYANNWANSQFLNTSSVLVGDMRTGSSAILEAGKTTKVNFDLGSYNWLNGVTQSKNIQTNAANESASTLQASTRERVATEIMAANQAGLYTTAAGLGLKSNVDTSGSDFSTKVVDAGDRAAAAIGSIAAMFGGGGFSGGAGAGGNWSTGSTNFTDCLFEGGFVDGCTGVSIPGLKYTNPQGVTSVINPMNYISGGGITNYIGLRARGGLIEKPEVAMIGEAGSEMVLPHDITQEIVDLTAMGRAAKTGDVRQSDMRTPPAGDIIVKLYLDGRELTNAVMSRSASMMRQKGLTIRG